MGVLAEEQGTEGEMSGSRETNVCEVMMQTE
jgi:hypothetical protein